MDFVSAIRRNLTTSAYVDFSGRASRSEYWWFYLATLLISYGALILYPAAAMIASLVFILPSLATAVRRFHDIGKSGWYLLVGLIPIIGFFIVLYWLVQPSEKANAYGKGPAKA